MMRSRRAFTIVEALTGIVLLAILLAAVYIFLSGHILQSRHLEGYLELQRDTRLAILRLQRDLKSLVTITRAERDGDARLERLEFTVPVDDEVDGTIRYGFEPQNRAIRRNGTCIIEETIKDMRLWLLDEQGRDIYGATTFDDVQAIRLQVTVTTPPQPGQPIPADETLEKLAARGRVLDFTIFPRIPVSRRKARQGKLNLETGRFPVSRATTSP